MGTYNIAVNLTKHSRLGDLPVSELPFGKIFSDHMFVVDYDGKNWQNPRVEPYGPIPTAPSMMAVHYGQAIFEGMKAFRQTDGGLATFRAIDNVRRLNLSAQRLCMPTIPEDLFMQGLETLLQIDGAWTPNEEGGSLYIRPVMYATDEFVGVRPSTTYKLVILTCPVGPYYSKPVRLLAAEHYVRAAIGGVGEAKAAGNYAASLLPAKEAQAKGFDQVLWLDAKEFKYIQEVGTMNIFFVIDGKVITPATDGAILKGITRDSIIKLLKHKGYTVEERLVSIDEICEAHEKGTFEECFGAGTAAVIAPVCEISYKNNLLKLSDKGNKSVASYIKNTIHDIRCGLQPDEWGWVKPIPTAKLSFV